MPNRVGSLDKGRPPPSSTALGSASAACYGRFVSRSRTRSPLLSALFALILGLFVAGPLVDAATCGLEGVDTCETSLIEGGHSQEDASHTPDTLHGCGHGHCHAAADVPPLTSDGAEPSTMAARLAVPPDFLLTSRAPDGLIRPPRA